MPAAVHPLRRAGRPAAVRGLGRPGAQRRGTRVRARGEATLLMAEADVVATLSPVLQSRLKQSMVDTVVERLASTTERLSKFINRSSG